MLRMDIRTNMQNKKRQGVQLQYTNEIYFKIITFIH